MFVMFFCRLVSLFFVMTNWCPTSSATAVDTLGPAELLLSSVRTMLLYVFEHATVEYPIIYSTGLFNGDTM